MLAKLTSKNQITLPKAILALVPESEYFDVSTENGVIRLAPVQITNADSVRAKLAELGIDEQDIEDAVTWSRQH